MESHNLQEWTRIGAMNPQIRKLLICRASVLRFMESKWTERKLSILTHHLAVPEVN